MVTKDFLKKLKPMLAVSAEPFDSREYIYEVKWDGFRCLSFLGDTTALQSRNNLDFTWKFPELEGLHRCTEKPVIVDGEIVIMDAGIPSFYELQKRGWAKDQSAIAKSAREKPATYVIFDILYAGNDKLIGLPFLKRKEILKEVLQSNERIYISEGIPEHGIDFFRACVEKNLEGIVAKKADSVYIPGKRSPCWKKIKKFLEGEFVVCGYKQTVKGSSRTDSLLLGAILKEKLVFQGLVGSGLGGVIGGNIYKLLKPLESDKPLFKLTRKIVQGLNWVRPAVCVSVQFLEPAKEGGLRHPVFRGIREDLEPKDCSGIEGALAGRRGIIEQ